MASVVSHATQRGLLPMTNFNRIHAVPPINITVDEAHEGLRILDQALSEARANRA